MFTNIFNKMLHFIYPEKCILCKNISETPVCSKCQQITFTYYGESKELTLDIDYIALFKYEDNIKTLLEELKFKKNLKVLPIMQNALLKFMPKLPKVDMIIPVPLNPERAKLRGFNQAELLIKRFAQVNNLPLRNDIVYRQYNTQKSYDLSLHDRQKQATKAFFVWANKKTELNNKNILIFDDLITSGSTITEIAKVLRSSNPHNVRAISFARPLKSKS